MDEQGLTPDQLLGRGLSSTGANPTLALLSKLGAHATLTPNPSPNANPYPNPKPTP
jgi:hypothetical protein